jgi:signal transduction histidine kinase
MKIADIVEAALATARPAAADCDVKLISRIEDGDAYVAADASRMQQVIGNILSNAIKFSPKGREVELRVGRAGKSLQISVSDQGEGIEPSFLPYVFDRLRQGNLSSRTGLGLGLAIARHIVELHHGEINAESDGPGKGARFTVLLPLLESHAVEEAPRETAHA